MGATLETTQQLRFYQDRPGGPILLQQQVIVHEAEGSFPEWQTVPLVKGWQDADDPLGDMLPLADGGE